MPGTAAGAGAMPFTAAGGRTDQPGRMVHAPGERQRLARRSAVLTAGPSAPQVTDGEWSPCAWDAGVVAGEELSGSYLEAIQRGFQFARELGRGCRPVHFLVGVAGGRGPAAAALAGGAGRPLRAVVTAAGDIPAGSAAYLHGQAQGAAVALADSLGQRPAAEHLLVALIDQGTAEVLHALSRAGLDPAAIRGPP
jgi:hypothetical protein